MKRKIVILVCLTALGGILYLILSWTNLLERSTSPIPKMDLGESEKASVKNIPPVTVVAENLSAPWALAFLPASPNGSQGGPDNRLLVTERGGKVSLIEGKSVKTIASIKVHQDGESGLHGVAVDPDFSSNQYVYLYYTYQSNGKNTMNRVTRFKFSESNLSNETTIVDNIPGARIHDGGRIKFGLDGYLYITTGDAADPSLSQNTSSLAGKILRVDSDGNAATDNPFKNRVYSYGHRNPQGIAWDASNQLFATEHGSSATDEFNKIQEGGNYGWPTIKGGETQNGMLPPIMQSGDDTWAPAGLAYLNGKFYFGGLRGNALFEIEEVNGEYELTEHFKGEFGRIREVVSGPDGMLYITTSNRDGRGISGGNDDKVLRINPDKL